MRYSELDIPGLWVIEPEVLKDGRGYFMESYKQQEFETRIGAVPFIQENESFSCKGVLRGLHYQLAPYGQAKLVRVIQGEVLDVAVDIRTGSPTFGSHAAVLLSGENKKQLFIPRGFAHGFKVISETALFQYKVDNIYKPGHEAGIRFNDPALGIDWGVEDESALIISGKDKGLPLLREARFDTCR
jgi:dTDP-4-dehydrorhamnose 3,5-epimerase